jgi:hypothetical protein
MRALEAKYASIDHLDGFVEALTKDPSATSTFFGTNLMNDVDESKLPALVSAATAAGVWQVPTQVLLDNLLNDVSVDDLAARPEMKYMPPETIKNWIGTKQKFLQTSQAERAKLLGLRRRFIKALHDAGVPFALGSDAPQYWNVPGFSVHRELRSMVDAGLTPYQALRTGTVNVGVYFKTESTTGTIATGKRADLLLLDANPLQNIDNSWKIAGVMVNGRWLSKADIDKRLAEGS